MIKEQITRHADGSVTKFCMASVAENKAMSMLDAATADLLDSIVARLASIHKSVSKMEAPTIRTSLSKKAVMLDIAELQTELLSAAELYRQPVK